ncbi:MAG: late competence development ComFB family protein [Clostridiales bacterium]|nr:late competence development ComFB family protein [Clostridiales bacterium]
MPKLVSKNLMEELVDMTLDSFMKEVGVCACPQCRADVRAYALNHLPPKYVVSTGGGIFVRVNALTTQAQADIASAIMSGIRVVEESPRHKKEDMEAAH